MTIPILIPLLPFLASILIWIFGNQMSAAQVAKTGVYASWAAALFAVWTLFYVGTQGTVQFTFWTLNYEGSSIFKVGMLVDRLTAVMMMLITSVSVVIHTYSVRYLEGDSGYARFFSLLSFTTFVILALVSSPNLLMLFIFWQLLGWALYLLLNFNYSHPDACRNGFKSFFIHRVGDVGFLFGLFLAYKYFGTLEFTELFKAAAENSHMVSLLPGNALEVNVISLIGLSIFVGAIAKSSQFPLHVWLPDTMDSPTPVSALMHAGIINAGGFLLNRLAPFYALSPSTLHFVFFIGVLTVLMGASIMLVQNDIKKTLGFSTMAQMGYMIMECGLGAFALAIFHLIAHGFFKASLFLGSGTGIHTSRYEPKHPHSHEHDGDPSSSKLTWATGLVITLIMPMVILLVTHDILNIHLQNVHGAVIFLFFSWVTVSQVMFSLYRLQAVASWIVAFAMIGALFVIGFAYFWAGEEFTHFLYPGPGEAEGLFLAASFPPLIFDLIILASTGLFLLGWFIAYNKVKGQKTFISDWLNSTWKRMYILLINRFYIDQIYVRWNNNILRLAQKVAHRF